MNPTLEDTLRIVHAMWRVKTLDAASSVHPSDAMHHWDNIAKALETVIRQREEEQRAARRKTEETMKLADLMQQQMIRQKDQVGWLYDEALKSDLGKLVTPPPSLGASSKYSGTTKSAGTSTSSTKKA